jgi:protein gp37
MAKRFCANGETDQSGEVVLSLGPFAGFATKDGWTGRVELDESKLCEPLRRRKSAVIFVNSMSDLWHQRLPVTDIAKVYATMYRADWHKYIVLTKRSRRRADVMQGASATPFWNFVSQYAMKRCHQIAPHIIEGVSVESPKHLDRLDDLRDTPAACRMLSAEPLLGDLGRVNLEGIGWVICGGESGPGARPCRVEWIESIIEQCRAASVPCFVKQLGNKPIWAGAKCSPIQPSRGKNHDITEWPEALRVQEIPDALQRS